MAYEKTLYIDESGNPGKSDDDCFVMVAVAFDHECDFRLQKTMRTLRRSLGWPSSAEFKFHKTRKEVLRRLLEDCKNIHFEARAVVLDTSKVTASSRGHQDDYKLVLAELLKLWDLQGYKMILDGDAGKKYQKNLLTYLRREVGEISRGNFRLEDSKKADGIQLADVIAGALRRSLLPEDRERSSLYGLIKSKVLIVEHI